MKTHNEVIADMRQRAAVALRQDADAMIHHNAVGGMLSALAYEAEAAHKREVEKLRGVIAGLREKMGGDDLLKMARDIDAKNAEIDSLRGELKKVYRVLWNCASAGWECENCRRDCGLHKMGIVKMPEG